MGIRNVLLSRGRKISLWQQLSDNSYSDNSYSDNSYQIAANQITVNQITVNQITANQANFSEIIRKMKIIAG